MASPPKSPRRAAAKTKVRRATKNDKTIGIRLRARRLEMHLSQEVLASKLGVSFQQVQKYEKGVNRIGSGRLVEIADALQVDTAYFLDDLNGEDSALPTASRFMGFLATKDGADINEVMMKLSEPFRRAVIELARSLARAYGV